MSTAIILIITLPLSIIITYIFAKNITTRRFRRTTSTNFREPKSENKSLQSVLDALSQMPFDMMWCIIDSDKRIHAAHHKIQEIITDLVGAPYLLSVLRSSIIDNAVDTALKTQEVQELSDINLFDEKWTINIMPFLNTDTTVKIEGIPHMVSDIRPKVKHLMVTCRPTSLRDEAVYQEEQDYFLQNVAHELRSPLTTIIGFLELMEAKDEQQQEMLDRIKKQSKRLDQIVQQTMLLSSSISRDIEMQALPVALTLQKLIDNFAEKAKQKNIKINLVLPHEVIQNPQAFCVQGNSDLLNIAFGNLLDNALKYSEESSTINLALEDGFHDGIKCMRIKFIDKGAGIPPLHQEKIFLRFYRVDSSRARNSGGAGIGLALTKRIVDLHQGEIKLESEFSKGSTFTVCLRKYEGTHGKNA